MIVFWTLTAPIVPAQKMPPPLSAKLALMVSFSSVSVPVKWAEASMPPPSVRAGVVQGAVAGDGGVGDGRGVGARAGRLHLDAAAASRRLRWRCCRRWCCSRMVSVVPLAKTPPPAAPLVLPWISRAGDGRAGAALLDAAAVADGRVVEEEAVGDGQGAQVVLVGEAAAGRAGEVVLDGAVGDGDGAVAGVADAAGRAVDGRVVADERPGHGQGGAVAEAQVGGGRWP